MDKLRVVQVGGPVDVVSAITEALSGKVEMTMLDIDRIDWPWWARPFQAGARTFAAERIASDVRNWRPPFDVAHYHADAARAATISLAGIGPQPLWILHLHSDELTSEVRKAMSRAHAVIVTDPALTVGEYVPLERLLDVYSAALIPRVKSPSETHEP